MTNRRFFSMSFFFLCSACLAGNMWAQSAALPGAVATAGDKSALSIGPGDTLEINVYNVPELILKTRVGENGSVALPLVGTLQVAGLTPAGAQQLLARKLIEGEYVKAPQVSIFVAEYATQGISVTGEVNQPGIYPLFGPHTLLDAIGAAGGMTGNAGSTVTITHRGTPEDSTLVDIGTNGTLKSPNLPVEAGDMITVAKAGIVYVVGEVNRPGGFVMGNNSQMTVVRAVALAMGTTGRARLKKVCIVRRRDAVVTLATIDLKKMLMGTAQDLPLQADDIVYVPNSGVRTTMDIVQKASVGAAAAAVIAF